MSDVQTTVVEQTTMAEQPNKRRRLALVASKGSLDMAYPPLILATTAASMGWEVGVFFTFYGLDILNKHKLPHLKVAPLGNPAMPAPLHSVPLQVPNFLGVIPGATQLATAIMKKWFNDANIPSIQELIDVARDSNVNLYACTTTMGVMGVHEEDLIPGASCLGAAAFLDFAADADVALFI